jgi:hypothetical protein
MNLSGCFILRLLRVNLFKIERIMEEVIFMVEESLEGGYTAKGLGVSIYTQADNIPALKTAVIDAVHCHYDDTKKRIIRLHIVREEVIAA